MSTATWTLQPLETSGVRCPSTARATCKVTGMWCCNPSVRPPARTSSGIPHRRRRRRSISYASKRPASAAMASCTSCARHRAASTRARIAGRRGPAMALPFRWRPNKARQPGGRNGSDFQGKPLARCESPLSQSGRGGSGGYAPSLAPSSPCAGPPRPLPPPLRRGAPCQAVRHCTRTCSQSARRGSTGDRLAVIRS